MGGARDVARALAIQPDDKIIVAGESTDDGLTDHSVLTRLTTTGALDTSFGANGIVTYSTYTTSHAYPVKVQSDGKILVGGTNRNVAENAPGPTAFYLRVTIQPDSLILTSVWAGS